MRSVRFLLLAVLFAVGAAACGDDEAGYYDVNWTVLHGGNTVTCESVGADTVEVLATHAQSGEGFADLFDCNDYGGTTSALPLGDYTVQVNILQGGNALGTSDPFTAEPILADGQVVDLPDIVFAF